MLLTSALLSLHEIINCFSTEELWLKGGFPDVLIEGSLDKLNYDWFEFYTRTLIERDLPRLGIEVDNRRLRLLCEMMTHFHGEVLNKNKIASSMGNSSPTVGRYLDILEQTFTVHLLPPNFANLKKNVWRRVQRSI